MCAAALPWLLPQLPRETAVVDFMLACCPHLLLFFRLWESDNIRGASFISACFSFLAHLILLSARSVHPNAASASLRIQMPLLLQGTEGVV